MTDFFDYQSLVPDLGGQQPAPRFRLGTVSAVNADRTINVTVAASTTVITSVKYLGDVQPVPSAPVWLVSDGFDMFAFGVVAAADRTFAPRASRATDQSISDAVETAITFDAVNSDAWGAWSVSNPTRLTAKITGRYLAVGTVTFAANANGGRSVWIEKNATTTLARVQLVSALAGLPTWLNVTAAAFDMIAGDDYVRLMVRQNAGTGSLNVTAPSSSHSPSLSLIYLGP